MLRKETREDVQILRLDRPERLNAWDGATREAVREALGEAEANPAVKAVVITGTGRKAFCAGADLTDKTIGLAEAAPDRMRAYRELYDAIQSFSKPLVAALNGLALGSAFQSVLLMDYRVAHRGVRFGLPEINSGLPCITGSTLLVWAIGAARARNMAISGRFVDAEEALQLGLIDEVVEETSVLGRGIEVANNLAEKSPAAFAATKRWFRDMISDSLDGAFRYAGEVRASESMSRSIGAGVDRFLAGGRGSSQTEGQA